MEMNLLKNRIRTNRLLYAIAVIPYLPVKIMHCVKELRRDRRILSRDRERLGAVEIKEGDILYFGVPCHMNAGDMAQTYCTRIWLKTNYPDAAVHEFHTAALLNEEYLNEVKKMAFVSNIIFFQSGYTTQDKHPDHAMHKKVVRSFPDNKIVFLPQTVNIQSKKQLSDTVLAFRQHHHLLFLARDHVSYEVMRAGFDGIRIEEYPDIVTSLIGEEQTDADQPRRGILLCLRNDDEKLYSTNSVMKAAEKLKKYGEPIEITDTTLSDVDYEDVYREFDVVFQTILMQYRRSKVVITDRYHGIIFSAVTNTPVVVLSTNDHKVRSGADWFVRGGYDSVKYADSIEGAVRIADSILQDFVPARNNGYFKKEYYDILKMKIDSL